MIHRELAAVTIVVIGVAAFYGSRQLDKNLSTVPASPETTTKPAGVVVSPETHAPPPATPSSTAPMPTVAPEVSRKPAPTAPVAQKAPQRAPVKTAPVAQKAPQRAPVKTAPVAVKLPRKVRRQPGAGALPLPTTAPSVNPDDSPSRTKSGKVKASTNPDMPPSFGPLNAKVHVIVYSDFQ